MLKAILLILSAVVLSSYANCPVWVPVPPQDYSKKYVSVTDSNAATIRPYGYMPMNVVFGAATKKCVTVNDASGSGRHYEVAIDSSSGTACVQPAGGQQQCITGTGSICATVTANPMKFTFDCTSCEGSEVTFWYRVTLENASSGNFNDLWCQTRTPSYPESLKQTSGNVVIPKPVDRDLENSAAGTTPQWILTAIIAAYSTSIALIG